MGEKDKKDSQGRSGAESVLYIQDKKSFMAGRAKSLTKASFFVSSGIRANGVRGDLEEAARDVLESTLDVLFFADSVHEGLVKDILVLQSILDLAVARGALTEDTAALLAREYDALGEGVLRIVGPQPFSLEEFLGVAGAPALPAADRRELARPRDRAVRERPIAHVRAARTTEGAVLPVTNRGEEVLDVLRTLGKASIKDIAIRIRGVSEKTVQRELSRLVLIGKVKKEGERRWSTYSIA